jgi:hypothetical protein
MAIAEDDNIFAVIEAAAQLAPDSGGTNRGGAVVAKSHLAAMYGVIASRQLVPGAYVMHPLTYADILNFNSDTLDQVSLNVILETGQFGVIFGTRLIVSTRVPQTSAAVSNGIVYLVTTPDKLGRIPEVKSGPISERVFENLTVAGKSEYPISPKRDSIWVQIISRGEQRWKRDLLNLRNLLQTWLMSLVPTWEMVGQNPTVSLASSV